MIQSCRSYNSRASRKWFSSGRVVGKVAGSLVFCELKVNVKIADWLFQLPRSAMGSNIQTDLFYFKSEFTTLRR